METGKPACRLTTSRDENGKVKESSGSRANEIEACTYPSPGTTHLFGRRCLDAPGQQVGRKEVLGQLRDLDGWNKAQNSGGPESTGRSEGVAD